MTGVRILSGTPDPDTARALTGVLHQLPGAEPGPALPDSTTLLDVLARAAETGIDELPEVVVVHDRITPVPALEVIREIALRFPAVGVILLTADPSPAVLSGAMDAGARGVAGVPLSYDELGTRVEAAAAWAAGCTPPPQPPAARTARCARGQAGRRGRSQGRGRYHRRRRPARPRRAGRRRSPPRWSTSTCRAATSPPTSTSSSAAPSPTSRTSPT